MEPKIKVFTLPMDGDLYRFYYTEEGSLVCIRFYELMGTAFSNLEWSEVPAEARNQFETHYCK